MGAVAIVINGVHKEIRIPGEGVVPLPKMSAGTVGEEMGRAIGRIYHAKNLGRFPLFVTGHICLGRGITFQNELFLFDHQVLPAAFDTRADAYQAAGRGAGNVKGLPNFVERAATGFQPTLTTTQGTWKMIVAAENIASTLARTAHTTGNVVVTADELAIAANPKDRLKFSHVPVRLPLPPQFKSAEGRTVAEWQADVLAHIALEAPAIHEDIVAKYLGDGHVNHYFATGSPAIKTRYALFRRIKEAARQGTRAPVPKFADMRRNHWYAELDHSEDHMVICRYEGALETD
jgi:hypothetical protein